MNINFATEKLERRVKIKVIGVGGAGGNAVNRMIENGLQDVDFFAINTDSQALEASRAHQTLVIGSNLTRGLGAGGDPDIGRKAAEEDHDLLAALVEDADMVFVTAGMGGGTGTGAAPLVAAAARASGALTVAVVTRPFIFEGIRRMTQAEEGLAALREQVDALLVIPNERLMEIEVPDSSMTSVFQVADNVLYEATRGISDIIAQHAVVNLDFADVRTVMRDSGAAIMGSGLAAGPERARIAVEQAICSPLLESVDILGSRAVLVYLTAACVSREDLRETMDHVQQAAGSDAHIFFGFSQDENMGEDLRVTVIATGFSALSTDAPTSAGIMNGAQTMCEPLTNNTEMAIMGMHPEDLWQDSLTCLEPVAPLNRVESGEHADQLEQTEQAGESEQSEQCVQIGQTETPHQPGFSMQRGEDDQFPVTPAMSEQCIRKQTEQPDPAVVAKLCMVASAGESSDTSPAADQHGPRSATIQRFLEPLGSVKLQDQDVNPSASSAKYRKAERGEDMLRPAWERKYVD